MSGEILKRFFVFFARKPWGKVADRDAENAAPVNVVSGGALLEIWKWVSPFLLGLAAGWFCMVCLEVGLDSRNRQTRPAAAVTAVSSAQAGEGMSMSSFLKANPFKITPQPTAARDDFDAPVEIVGSLAAAVLRWPVPDVGALLEDQEQQWVVLVGGSFDVYTLSHVDDRQAVFVRGEDRVVKELLYGGKTPGGAAAPRASSARGRPAVSAATGSLVAADPTNGTQGRVSRDTINNLVENPMDELDKMRIRPSPDKDGMQLEMLKDDSLFKQLGLRESDVVSGINGIPIRNTMDLANIVGSVINSDRFDVDVKRDGKPTLFQYVVD